MKLAIIVGHNSIRQGAVRRDTNETEYIWNSRLAQLIKEISPEYGIDVKVFRRVSCNSYKKEIEKVYNNVDVWGADASIELHFNSAESEQATGTETFSNSSPLSLKLASEVQAEMVIALGLKDRGIKTISPYERGGQSLISGRCPGILVEPFFGSSQNDQNASDEFNEQERLARSYLRGCSVAFDGFPRKDLKNSRTIEAAEKQRKAAQGGTFAGGGCILTEVVGSVIGDVKDVGGASEIFQPLSQYLPWASGFLALIGIGLFIYSRIQTERIEAARIDDFERKIR